MVIKNHSGLEVVTRTALAIYPGGCKSAIICTESPVRCVRAAYIARNAEVRGSTIDGCIMRHPRLHIGKWALRCLGCVATLSNLQHQIELAVR